MKTVKESQINIPIDLSSDNSVSTISRTWNKQMIHAGAIPFYRSFFYVLSTIFSFLTMVFLAVQLFQNYPQLPEHVPLIYSHALNGWEVINKQYLIVFLAGLLIFSILSPFINSKIYFFDKRLVLIINIAVIIIDCLILIAFSEIFSLIMI